MLTKYTQQNFLEELKSDVLFDPQTSGGLLISLPDKYKDEIDKYNKNYKIIGKVTKKQEKPIKLIWGRYERSI